MDKALTIVTQMYRCRDAALSFLGEEKFRKRVDDLKSPFLKACDDHKKNHAQMLTKILEKAGDDGHQALMITAMVAEIMEPVLKPRV